MRNAGGEASRFSGTELWLEVCRSGAEGGKLHLSAPQPKPAPEASSLPLVTLSPEEGSPQPPQRLWATLGGVWVVQMGLMKCPS